jgi:hypothetical protein
MRVSQLADMLISAGLIHEDAVYDSDGYDGGRTYDNICALFDKLFPPSTDNPLQPSKPSKLSNLPISAPSLP